MCDLNFFMADFPAMAMIEFSQSVYTAVEGGDPISVCISLVSLTGQFTEGPLFGLAIQGSPSELNVSGLVNLTGVEVNETVFCETLMIEDDNIVLGPQQFNVSAFIEGPESITFTPDGDRATIIVADNDGMYLYSSNVGYIIHCTFKHLN